jgi:uncharacterized protein YuzE
MNDTKIKYDDQKPIVDKMVNDQDKRMKSLLVEGAAGSPLTAAMGVVDRTIEKNPGITAKESKKGLNFKLYYDEEVDVLTIQFADETVKIADRRCLESADAFYDFDSIGNPIRIELPKFSENYSMQNENKLPLKHRGEGIIDVRYNKDNDVLYIHFGKCPETSEENPNLYGVMNEYNEEGKTVGYTIVSFAEFFYRGREDLPTLNVEI